MGEWLPHDGRGVPPDAKPTDRVEVVERDGDVDAGLVDEFFWVWAVYNGAPWCGDIMRYRINPSDAAVEALKALADDPKRKFKEVTS